uniref:Clat_adaptor_s domain-containing protein n=1 Tax=Macrostomum lignano TaxID=282301 RepID=A0A1I8FAS1_9PLAT
MHFMLLFSRQGKLRLQKWYMATSEKMKKRSPETWKPKMCAFIEWKDLKIVYKRYASLYFCCAIEQSDNELLCLGDHSSLCGAAGSVCELDIIFNFEKAYFMLDEFMLGARSSRDKQENVCSKPSLLRICCRRKRLRRDSLTTTGLAEFRQPERVPIKIIGLECEEPKSLLEELGIVSNWGGFEQRLSYCNTALL